MAVKTPLTPFIEAVNLMAILAAMCMPDPVDVLFADGAVDFEALPASVAQWVPYTGQKTEKYVRAMIESGHAEGGHVVNLLSDKRTSMHQAVRLTRRGQEAVCEHERLMHAKQKTEALDVMQRIFGFSDAMVVAAKNALK